ncbi:chromate resistance protein ChrB domain-containing protein, partial [Salmonella sp. SAL4431]|uniref:chromate resistance protein ChrB domain-containing protein n=1 Tax=Salmonella sp. SAL4431 TaxID=3159886 RepID=UPI00397A57F4
MVASNGDGGVENDARTREQPPGCAPVADPADAPAGATPFDMRGVDLSHHGADCTFETLLRRNTLD